MRVHLDGVNTSSSSGPNTFARRFAQALYAGGHEPCFTAEGADVSLVFIEPSGARLAPKVVQRLDGIWFKPDEFEAKNRSIRALYDRADAVIWQSDFDRRMTTKWWGQPRHGTIIHNGIDTTPVKELTISSLVDLRSQYKKMYVCSANWHPQKRLAANVRLFECLQKQEPSSCLIVLGAHPDVRATGPHVFYAGSQPPEVYNEIYSAANWMLHLAWADHCPNVVIEALAQGTPVVCSDVGGTKELIGTYGMVLKEQAYDFELADYDNPPDVDVTQVVSLPERQQLDYSSIADIDIRHVTERYVRLFESLLRP